MPKLQELIAIVPSSGTESAEVLDAVQSIISVETLTILQLLGFNFKKAVGEPLTELVAALISARTTPPATLAADLQRLAVERELAYIELAKDEDAYRRLRVMFPAAEDAD